MEGKDWSPRTNTPKKNQRNSAIYLNNLERITSMSLLEYTPEDAEVFIQALTYAIEEDILFEEQKKLALDLLEFFKMD